MEFFREVAMGWGKVAVLGAVIGAAGVVGCAQRGPYGLPAMEADTSVMVSGEKYDKIVENVFLDAASHPLSTFSIDVDTASYSNVRRMLTDGALPPAGAVRIEEMINYFNYEYPQPEGDEPFSVTVEMAACPWKKGHKLARIGLKGREINTDQRPATNLVFLLDVSGSMNSSDKLPLVKEAMSMLVETLRENDRVAIVTYAGSSGVALEPTNDPRKIRQAFGKLNASGSTNGGQGIHQAYKLAKENFIKEGINRVILCTDGDFNVGVTSNDELVDLIEDKASEGVFLSVLGVGTGNLNDSMMEKLADKGNGNYAYIDSVLEAEKVLVEQMSGTLMTIAKDVKIQVDFNPAKVQSYRLIGYENRMLKAEDFKDDQKDAGEIGAGHTVTALYEIVPPGVDVEPSKYQQPTKPVELTDAAMTDEMFVVRLRYKKPDGQESQEFRVEAKDVEREFDEASGDLKFASSVAAFGMLLRGSEYKGSVTFDDVIEIAKENKGEDENGYRAEFVSLVKLAKRMEGKKGDES
jgi:Ca-activated chloride channel family protein